MSKLRDFFKKKPARQCGATPEVKPKYKNNQGVSSGAIEAGFNAIRLERLRKTKESFNEKN